MVMDVPRYRHNSTFKVRNPKPRKRLDVPGPRLRAGRRMNEWSKVWAWLKPRLEKAGRTSCEFDFLPHDCWGRLDPAHSKKRSKMQGLDVYTVAIACAQAHRVLDEAMSHSDMEKTVLRAIERHGGLILPNTQRTASASALSR